MTIGGNAKSVGEDAGRKSGEVETAGAEIGAGAGPGTGEDVADVGNEFGLVEEVVGRFDKIGLETRARLEDGG